MVDKNDGGAPRDSLEWPICMFCAAGGDRWDGDAVPVMRGSLANWCEYSPPSVFCTMVGTGKLPDTASGDIPRDSMVWRISRFCTARDDH